MTLIGLISVTVAMYALVLFYVVAKEELQIYNPVPKFLSIKFIIMMSFWYSFYFLLHFIYYFILFIIIIFLSYFILFYLIYVLCTHSSHFFLSCLLMLFRQSIIVAGLVRIEVIHDTSDWTTENIAIGVQVCNFLLIYFIIIPN